MTQFVLKRRVGLGAALIAAYALVFNVILSSILVASVSPAAAAAHELCINSVDFDAALADAGKTGKHAAIRCPLCVGHHVTGGLLSPEPTVLIDHILVEAGVAFAHQTRAFASARSFDHLSRGPPCLT